MLKQLPEYDRIIIDASSVIKACVYAGTDAEFGQTVVFEGKPHKINSADHGYHNFMASYLATIAATGHKPWQTILVLDGLSSSTFRKHIYPQYKGQRKDLPKELYQSFNGAIQMAVKTLTGLGAVAIQQELVEADDIIAALCRRLRGHKTVLCRDKDMLALRGPDVTVLYNGEHDVEIHESCPAGQHITLFKALVGDSSDNLKGAAGFGPGAFTDFTLSFGNEGLDDMCELISTKTLHTLETDGDKLLDKIVASADSVYKSWDCAKFYPELLNTGSGPEFTAAPNLPWQRPDDHRLGTYAATAVLATDQSHITNALAAIRRSPYIALDIETSTPPESDAWIAAIQATKSGKKGNMVDVFGSELTGLSITCGDNLQHTFYFPVDHRDTKNWTPDQVLEVIMAIPEGTPVVVHNSNFELPVLYNTWGGWVEGVVDTAALKSYVNENTSLGLKLCSKDYLGYKQGTYEQVTTKRVIAKSVEEAEALAAQLPEGGKEVSRGWVEKGYLKTPEIELTEELARNGDHKKYYAKAYDETDWYVINRQYKMNELTGKEVFHYGCDDTICTAALFNRFLIQMELEDTLRAYELCDMPAHYWVAKAFIDGFKPDLDRLKEVEIEDRTKYYELETKLNAYMLRVGWEGAEFRPLMDLSPASIKDAFFNITGAELDCKARLPEKIAAAIEEQGQPELAELVRTGDLAGVNATLEAMFDPTPNFDVEKDDNIRKLMYEVWGLPIRFRTVPTDIMRSKGITEGNPQVDKYAFEHALVMDFGAQLKALQDTEDPDAQTAAEIHGIEEKIEILKTIREMREINTRDQLYYTPYPLLAHWKDGKIHVDLGQCRPATRRFAPREPNVNQLSKRGDGKRVRGVVKAYPGWVVVAMDFSGQELRLAAEESRDEALLSCYIGENPRDPHSLTGAGIAAKKGSEFADYDLFVANLEHKDVKKFRGDAKGVNFGSQYLCRAPKLGKLLTVPPEEAQEFLDAKNEVYFGLAQWQQDTIVEAHDQGFVTTRLGARRHLAHKLNGRDKWEAMEAERQCVNFRIQASGAEMIKQAINGMQEDGLYERDDIIFIFPVHDETVHLIREDSLYELIPLVHARMVQNYANMIVPLESEISIGYDFANLKKVGAQPTAENITRALEALRNGN